MTDERAKDLKKLLWKLGDEFVSMNYEGRESTEMRWFEGDILAVQEEMTQVCDLDGDGVVGEMRTIGWLDFQKKYATGSGVPGVQGLRELFEEYEDSFQRIIYRRFKKIYANGPNEHENPADYDEEQEKSITEERKQDPGIDIVVPDHRVRRLQHLLSDLVKLLDQLSTMEFNRPVRRCDMWTENSKASEGENLLRLETARRIPCDCRSRHCNPKQEDFEHRQLNVVAGKRQWLGLKRMNTLFPPPAKQMSV
jgi:hypothetical protein